ncbi:MAG: hypothetical protein ACUVTD_02440 [Nitrososphaerales archaeon]
MRQGEARIHELTHKSVNVYAFSSEESNLKKVKSINLNISIFTIKEKLSDAKKRFEFVTQ